MLRLELTASRCKRLADYCGDIGKGLLLGIVVNQSTASNFSVPLWFRLLMIISYLGVMLPSLKIASFLGLFSHTSHLEFRRIIYCKPECDEYTFLFFYFSLLLTYDDK